MIGPRLITPCGIMHYHATHFNAQRGIEIACRRCTVIWATRRLGDRRLGDKFFPKWTFGRHEIGRLGDKDETFGRQLNLVKCVNYRA